MRLQSSANPPEKCFSFLSQNCRRATAIEDESTYILAEMRKGDEEKSKIFDTHQPTEWKINDEVKEF